MIRSSFFKFSRYIVLAVVLVSSLALLISASVVGGDPVEVTFPDANLESAIREAIAKPTGPIYDTDLVGLATFSADSRGIVDLTGLEYCTGLTNLSLRFNQIGSLSSLAGLTGLTRLYLDGNQTDNLTPLSGLTGLTQLGLNSNQVSDLTPLSSLTNLTYLWLDSNQVSGLTPLSGLTNLTYLHLNSNQIDGISPLAGLANLTYLFLGGNQISNLAPLSGLTSLKTLNLGGNQIANLSPLSSLTSLTQVYLGNNQIGDLSPLSALTSLVEMSLNNNQISDLSPLSSLTSLKTLNLGANQVSDLSPLSILTGLTGLDLYANQIGDLSALSGLTGLTRLHLYTNQISDLSALSGLTSLTDLILTDNQISDLSALVGLTSLTKLWLMDNNVSDLSPLSGLTSMWDLEVDDNPVSNLSALSGLTNLWGLSFDRCQIRDLQPLVDNPGMGPGDVVEVRGDPLNANSVNTCIPALEGRGVTVRWDYPTGQCPDRPSNDSPADGVTGVDLTAVLVSSAFSDPDVGDDHEASQWQVTTTPGDYSGPVFDSDTDMSNLTSIIIPPLDYSTTYYWRVAHQDDNGAWSAWSTETSFMTHNPSPEQPTNVSPPNGATGVELSPTLWSSAYIDLSEDAHIASQWQVRTISGDYASPIFDSLTDNSNLVQITLPSGIVGGNSSYCWRVRHQDEHGAWSLWSAETSFTTLDRPPDQPANASPANGATGIGLTPTLESSAFSDPDAGDLHTASQWQVRTISGDYGAPIFDSLVDSSHLLQITLPSGILGGNRTYYWRVRHQDEHGEWSAWSAETFFTSLDQPPDQPANASPANGATGVELRATLRASAFSDPDGGDTHAASQWQVTVVSGDYSTPVFDSMTDTSDLSAITVPTMVLKHGTIYYWRVRYQDQAGSWSEWSQETSFVTLDSAGFPFWPWTAIGLAVAVGLALSAWFASGRLRRRPAGTPS